MNYLALKTGDSFKPFGKLHLGNSNVCWPEMLNIFLKISTCPKKITVWATYKKILIFNMNELGQWIKTIITNAKS